MACSPTDFLKVTTNVAHHFGFATAETLRKSPDCTNCNTSFPHNITAEHEQLDNHDGVLVNGLRTYCDAQLHARQEPTLLYDVAEHPLTKELTVGLHIFGVSRSIAEAILIQLSRAILDELGHQEHAVRINSLGDAESLTRYTKELTNFLRKRLEDMPVEAREAMKDHPLQALLALIELEHELAYRSPSPLEFLSDQSRKHFREIVEYLDMSETAYEIDPKLLGHHRCYSDALFAIDTLATDSLPQVSVRGGRYDTLTHETTRSRIPAVGAVMTLHNSKTPSRHPRPPQGNPSVYVVHLGFGPKVRSLLLIDTLRRAGIPVHHNLACDSLSEQLRDAERRGVAYTLIIGQKEFVENNVILRDMQARSQEQIELGALVRKLRRRAGVTATA